MYLWEGIAQPYDQRCPVNLESEPTDAGKFQRIREAIECELKLKFVRSDDPGLFKRRQRLEKLFRAVPASHAETFAAELAHKVSGLAKLFDYRLATPTRRQMLGILAKIPCQAFSKEYEFRFNPLSDRFSVDTNPAMAADEKDARKRDVNALVDGGLGSPAPLWRRLTIRAQAALDFKVPAAMPALTAPLEAVVKRLSDAQLSLFREAFPDGKGGIRFDRFQRCFEQFANGELRDPSVTGHPALFEPNGPPYFLFAEFAFLCIELNFNKSEWEHALRTFVKTQEIFMHVYRDNPKSPPPAVGAPLPPAKILRPLALFDFGNFRQVGPWADVGKGQSNLTRKLALRRKYDSMSVAALREAARDNLWRALRMT